MFNFCFKYFLLECPSHEEQEGGGSHKEVSTNALTSRAPGHPTPCSLSLLDFSRLVSARAPVFGLTGTSGVVQNMFELDPILDCSWMEFLRQFKLNFEGFLHKKTYFEEWIIFQRVVSGIEKRKKPFLF